MRTFSKRTLAAPAALAALGLVLTGCGSKATDNRIGRFDGYVVRRHLGGHDQGRFPEFTLGHHGHQ